MVITAVVSLPAAIHSLFKLYKQRRCYQCSSEPAWRLWEMQARLVPAASEPALA
jgi:hypothetical protein